MEGIFQKVDACASHPAQAMEIHNYHYGDEIVREGEMCPFFFVIMSGQIRISQKARKIRILGEQDIFGLESMVFNRPSCYTARALCNSRVAAYGPDALDHLIRESPRMVQSVLLSTLQQLLQTTNNLLQDADTFAIEDVCVNFYDDGEDIIVEGTRGTDFYRLVSSQGGLRVSVEGKEISRIDRPGEFFGEISGLLSLPRQSTVTSIGESVVEAYNLEDLEIIVRDYPEVAVLMIRSLVNQLSESSRKLDGTLK